MKSLKEFTTGYTGDVVGVPWGWDGECVSLTQLLINEVYGAPLYHPNGAVFARGNAWEFGNSLIREGIGYEVKASEAKYGDIVVWGREYADGLGHVGLVMGGGKVFDQSNGQRKTCQIRDYLANPIQFIRMKATPKPDGQAPSKTNDEIADEVIAGKWGNDPQRSEQLKKAGYDPSTIQGIVNQKLSGSKPTLKPVEVVAKEVIDGKWGNGAERETNLTKAGYDYDVVQAEVNRQLGATKAIKVGDKVKVTKAVDYNGKPFTTYHNVYDVIEVSGKRAVIGIGKTVTSSIHVDNLKKV